MVNLGRPMRADYASTRARDLDSNCPSQRVSAGGFSSKQVSERQTLNESPHPQVPVAFGLRNLNPAPVRPSR